jgi:hypothetical protein
MKLLCAARNQPVAGLDRGGRIAPPSKLLGYFKHMVFLKKHPERKTVLEAGA